MPKPLEISAKLHDASVFPEILSIDPSAIKSRRHLRIYAVHPSLRSRTTAEQANALEPCDAESRRRPDRNDGFGGTPKRRLFAHQPQRDHASQTRTVRIGRHCTSIGQEMSFSDTPTKLQQKKVPVSPSASMTCTTRSFIKTLRATFCKSGPAPLLWSRATAWPTGLQVPKAHRHPEPHLSPDHSNSAPPPRAGPAVGS